MALASVEPCVPPRLRRDEIVLPDPRRFFAITGRLRRTLRRPGREPLQDVAAEHATVGMTVELPRLDQLIDAPSAYPEHGGRHRGRHRLGVVPADGACDEASQGCAPPLWRRVCLAPD